MRNSIFFKFLLLLAGITLFVSCDKDYNEVGDALIGENHFDLAKDDTKTVGSAWKKTGEIEGVGGSTAIASNNLATNSLGVLDNSVFGTTTANFATQVELASINPAIDNGLSQKVQSVTLYIPYFTNKNVTTNADGSHIYTLDSIYGNKASKIKLNIYENKYLLGSQNTEPGAPLLDPSYPQLYYTNQNSDFNAVKGVNLCENNAFVFNPNEYKIETTDAGVTTTSYLAPGMRLDLNKDFFEDLLFDKSNSGYDLSNNESFKQYFKGLYFTSEKADAEGVLAMMNFKKGTITVNYTEDTSSADKTRVNKSIVLNLTGNTVNLLSNDTGSEYYSSPKSDRLYLRGGEGSVGMIDLFGSADNLTYSRTAKKIMAGSNGLPDELDIIKSEGWLINEASLIFYIDQTTMAGLAEPNKLVVYDVNNKTILSGGAIEKNASGRGVRYKVNITSYIRGLVGYDYDDVRLGVAVSQEITNANFKKVKNAPSYAQWQQLTTIEKNSYFYPESLVMNPLGTVLYGSNAVSADKRLKLEIYYTKPNP